jgi:hypothetical protein
MSSLLDKSCWVCIHLSFYYKSSVYYLCALNLRPLLVDFKVVSNTQIAVTYATSRVSLVLCSIAQKRDAWRELIGDLCPTRDHRRRWVRWVCVPLRIESTCMTKDGSSKVLRGRHFITLRPDWITSDQLSVWLWSRLMAFARDSHNK